MALTRDLWLWFLSGQPLCGVWGESKRESFWKVLGVRFIEKTKIFIRFGTTFETAFNVRKWPSWVLDGWLELFARLRLAICGGHFTVGLPLCDVLGDSGEKVCGMCWEIFIRFGTNSLIQFYPIWDNFFGCFCFRMDFAFLIKKAFQSLKKILIVSFRDSFSLMPFFFQ